MTTTYYKATRPNGTDFHSGTVNYAHALEQGRTVKHKRGILNDRDAAYYLSVSTKPGDCTGMTWPARLFEVEPVGEVWTPHKDDLPNKRAVRELRVIRELPAEEVFGKNAAAVLAIVTAYDALTGTQRDALWRERDRTAGWSDAYWRVAGLGGLASRAGLEAARDALGDRLDDWGDDAAAYGAALALLLRGNRGLSKADYATLTAPWRKLVGPAHPADKLPAKVA